MGPTWHRLSKEGKVSGTKHESMIASLFIWFSLPVLIHLALVGHRFHPITSSFCFEEAGWGIKSTLFGGRGAVRWSDLDRRIGEPRGREPPEEPVERGRITGWGRPPGASGQPERKLKQLLWPTRDTVYCEGVIYTTHCCLELLYAYIRGDKSMGVWCIVQAYADLERGITFLWW